MVTAPKVTWRFIGRERACLSSDTPPQASVANGLVATSVPVGGVVTSVGEHRGGHGGELAQAMWPVAGFPSARYLCDGAARPR